MMNVAFSEEEVRNFSSLLNYFKQLAEDGVTPLIEKQLLLMLDQSLPFFGHLHFKSVFPQVTRVTINKNVIGKNKRIRNIKDLKYPPQERVSKYGRCNLPKQSIFYSTFTELTAFGEMKPSAGDIVTISSWKLNDPNTKLKYCPIFKNQPKEKNTINPRMFEFDQIYKKHTSHYPIYFRQQMDDLIQFVADGFTKFIKPGNDLDYIFSAYFANKIFNEFENGTIDAIYYPSVQDKLHFENLAIKPEIFDKYYTIFEVHDEVLVGTPKTGSSGYWGRGFGFCKTFDLASGEILWDPQQLKSNEESILELKWKYGFDFAFD